MTSVESDGPQISKMPNQGDSSNSKQVVKSSDSMVRVLCDFSDIISIRVKGKFFNVPRDLLTATSVFFDEELNYSTPRKFFLVIDDVDIQLFNTYVNLLFESSLVPNFRIRDRNAPCRASWTTNIKFLLQLWKLSHRFINCRMCLLTEEALTTQYFTKLTPQRWETFYVKRTEACVRHTLLALQECYALCKNESIPFDEELVTACAKCPGQMVAAHFDHLDPGFRAAVVKSFVTRVADPKVAQRKLAHRKRHHEDDGEPKAFKKRRC